MINFKLVYAEHERRNGENKVKNDRGNDAVNWFNARGEVSDRTKLTVSHLTF